MNIAEFPRVRLASLPTALEPLERLSADISGPRLFVKRDDMTGLATGGNKTRKLEFAMAAAMQEGANCVITTGGIQSNHARQTAAAAARLGLSCELVLRHSAHDEDENYLNNGNILLDRLLGAKLHLHPAGSDRDALMADLAEKLRSSGIRPTIIPLGASYPTGNLGYADAAMEIAAQANELGITIDAIVTATSSGGTLAGLAAGFDTLGYSTQLFGVDVDNDPDCLEKTISPQIEATKVLMGHPGELEHVRVEILFGHAGAGYGLPSDEMREAVRRAAETEGLLLDPVYSGKAMAGLIALAKSGRFGLDANILFLHTGGVAGLFGYSSQLSS